MLFGVPAHYEKPSISKMYTGQFQGPGLKRAFVAETQCVGFEKEAGHYRSGAQLDSWPVFAY